jgi:hypothetical protein
MIVSMEWMVVSLLLDYCLTSRGRIGIYVSSLGPFSFGSRGAS